MSDVGSTNYVPDRLYERLFAPWKLRSAEWPLCKEDWARVDAITRLPWAGSLLDFGAGDGTLAAMVCSRNPAVTRIDMVESDSAQATKALLRWKEWPLFEAHQWLERRYDGALCCEVLEHMDAKQAHVTLQRIHRVLRPGGTLCVTVPHRGGSRADYPGHVRQFVRYSLGEDLEHAGFTLESTGGLIGNIWLLALARA